MTLLQSNGSLMLRMQMNLMKRRMRRMKMRNFQSPLLCWIVKPFRSRTHRHWSQNPIHVHVALQQLDMSLIIFAILTMESRMLNSWCFYYFLIFNATLLKIIIIHINSSFNCYHHSCQLFLFSLQCECMQDSSNHD